MADGNAKITISGDATGLKAATGQASDSLNKMKDKGEEGGKSLSQSFQQSTGRVLGVAGAIGAVIALADKAYTAFKQWRNAAGEISKELGDITAAQRIVTTEGENWKDAAIANANKVAEAQKAALEVEKQKRNLIEDAVAAATGYAEDAVKLQQIESARNGVLAQIEAKEKNIADFKAKQADDENRSQQMKLAGMRAELEGEDAKKAFDEQAKLQDILRRTMAETSEYRKGLLREEYDLQVQLNGQAAAAELEAWYANQALKEAAEAEAERKLYETRIDNERKIADERARRNRDNLGGIRTEQGGQVAFGRGAAWIVRGGGR